MIRLIRRLLVVMVLSGASLAQNTPAPVVSPEVHPDNTVTFRLRMPNAAAVTVDLQGQQPVLMTKDADGVWSHTTAAMEPDFYNYVFSVDSVRVLDPSNFEIKTNLLAPSNMFYVPRRGMFFFPRQIIPWEINEVAHGIVHRHFYHSSIVGDNRDFYVYTPPDYDPTKKAKYPVLYLLHGFSDLADAWTLAGRANIILDNLIAQGKAKPMLVVMPLGYGAPEIVKPGTAGAPRTELRDANFSKFTEALLTEVIPRVESEYAVDKKRDARAIAGLSMGGSESLLTGLNHLDQFSWIGAFSSGGLPDAYESRFPNLDDKANKQLHLLWVACGTDDGLITANRKFRDWLKSKGVNHTDIETPGAHTWMVWRRNLTAFAPLLFR